MAHDVWKGLIEAYAEGALRWPLTRIVEAHTKRCLQCRKELRIQMLLLQRIDGALFTHKEMAKTVALVTQRDLQTMPRLRLTPRVRLAPVVVGAVLIVIVLAFIPGRWQPWLGPVMRNASASSWGEGVAISVSVAGSDAAYNGSTSANSSGTGTGIGVSVSEGAGEWGG